MRANRIILPTIGNNISTIANREAKYSDQVKQRVWGNARTPNIERFFPGLAEVFDKATPQEIEMFQEGLEELNNDDKPIETLLMYSIGFGLMLERGATTKTLDDFRKMINTLSVHENEYLYDTANFAEEDWETFDFALLGKEVLDPEIASNYLAMVNYMIDRGSEEAEISTATQQYISYISRVSDHAISASYVIPNKLNSTVFQYSLYDRPPRPTNIPSQGNVTLTELMQNAISA